MANPTAAEFVEGQGVSETIAWFGIAAGLAGITVVSLLPKQTTGEEPSKQREAKVCNEERFDDAEWKRQHDVSAVFHDAKADETRTPSGEEHETTPVAVESAVPPRGKMTRTFLLFQRSFLLANVSACFADWLKGAYTMSLYKEYGYTLSQIVLLFVVTFLSSVVFGTIAGSVSDSLGRVRGCRLYCLAYAANLVLTTWNNVYALSLSRVLGGVSTSLLATSFESWMVTQHHSRGFNPAWLQDTFSKTAVLGSASAVIAGFAAEAAVRAMGNVGPFLVPLPFLVASLFFMRHWPENYGDRSGAIWRPLVGGCREIAQSRTLQLLLLCEALFEGSLGVWIVMWTPALDSTNAQTPFGLIFAAYTLCMVGGGLLARIFPLNPLLALCHGMGLSAMLLSAVFYERKVLVFIAFTLYEVSTGVYDAAHPTLRSSVMKDASRASVMSIVRVPMNLLVVTVLLIGPSPLGSLWLLVVLQAISGLAVLVLLRGIR